MKKVFALVFTLFLCVLFTGCDSIDMNIENLSKPPMLTEQQIKIFQAMQATNLDSNNIKLKYPQTGDYRSAIIIPENDEADQIHALVFYEKKTESDTTLFMSIAGMSNDEWIVQWSVPLGGTAVDKVCFFKDISRDRTYFLVGTMDETSNVEKTLQIFSFSPDPDGYSVDGQDQVMMLNTIDSRSYKMFEVYDIDNDTQDEIVLITQSKQISNKNNPDSDDLLVTKAIILKYQFGSFRESYSTNANDSVIDYVKITKNSTTFGAHALFIDELMSDSTYATEILVFDNNTFKNLIYSKDSTSLYNQTFRTQAPYCFDIDSDGRLEIPQTQYMNGYDSESAGPMYITRWNSLVGDRLETVMTTYINYARGFGITLYDDWTESISAKLVVENDEVNFFIYEGSLDAEVTNLFTVKVDTSINIQNKGIPNGYFKIKSTGQVVYLAKIYTDKYLEHEITENTIKQNFIDLY